MTSSQGQGADEGEAAAARVRVSAAEARRLAQEVLQGNGVPADSAALVARCLVAADIRGVDTHGINRVPS
ncbi:hypothetical protein CDD83_4792 [Cordyceps sp. RAO-2017]|nr:hypothetical protein CDD83_4792 [Cordyceps sp. RAO-2017]